MSDISISGNQKTIEEIINSQATSTGEKRNTGELGKNDFLQLLITQVQHQDPLNPSTDTEFIAQLAQFSALEQMQNLNKSFSYTMGFALMGKYVSGEVTDEATGNAKLVEGIVQSVRVMNGEVYAVVGDYDVPVNKILSVSDTNAFNNENIKEYSSIVGMMGKSTVYNDNGYSSYIEGIIASISKEKGGIFAILDEVEIVPHDLDIGAFENEEEYVKGMVNKEVTLKFKDNTTGEIFKVTGILRDGYYGKDGKLRLILDEVSVPASSITSTKKVDLLSTEQLLLSEILKELQKQNNPGQDEENPQEDAEVEEPDPETDL
ncbi:MAG: flagellar biosynthesis protein FlgD [Clostridiaceae bacterium]|nr:flagellar biosynthesis protein FlgD [Clostridiaceae bacterium]